MRALRDELGVRVNVRVWRHDLRVATSLPLAALHLERAWLAHLLARREPIGRVRLWDVGHNLVPTVGLSVIVGRLQGISFVGPLSHMAVGTGTTTPAATDTALVAEVFRDVFTQVTAAPTMLTIRNYLGPNDANGRTLTEAGLFNAASGPTLFARRLFSTPLVKTADSAATLEWTVTVAAVASLAARTEG